ncbi:hypothetical protein LJR230_004648 [Trinickia sp. LjRoot230]|uniref:hypothetical protein n=1 Tax=Trinickia sp. LjRoot230 TaxID=3342288 RepID=UPI003ED07487
MIAAYYKVQREPANRGSMANSRAAAIQSGLEHPLDILLMCKASQRRYDPRLDRSERVTLTTMTQAYDRLQRGEGVREVTSDLNIYHKLDVLLLWAISNEIADGKASRINNATMELVQYSIVADATSAEHAAIHWNVRNPDDFRELRICSAMYSTRENTAAASEETIANNQ